MGVDEELLNEMILFGSAAAGQMTEDSDIDPLVVAAYRARAGEVRGTWPRCDAPSLCCPCHPHLYPALHSLTRANHRI
jgi:hypothetical protein